MPINSKVSARTSLLKCSEAARAHIPVAKSSSQQKMFCIIVPLVYICQYGPLLINILSQTLSFSEKLRALKSFFINTYILILFCGHKKARHFLASSCLLDRMLGQQATRLASTPASRSKQAARATPKGSLLMLCALSPTSRPYLSLGLSIRATFFVDRGHSLCLASTEIPVFMDKIAKLTVVSIKTALFVDSPRFRWREYGQQATRLANMPTSRSKQATRATPKGSLRCFVPLVQPLDPISVWVCPSERLFSWTGATILFSRPQKSLFSWTRSPN